MTEHKFTSNVPEEGHRSPWSGAKNVAVVLLVVASLAAVSGVLTGPPPHPTDSIADSCSSDSGNDVAWHLERYGAGCHEEEFVRFPAGEQIDRVGDPPWVPL